MVQRPSIKIKEHGDKTVGFTAGVFDLFHIGHLNLLRKCKEQCDYLIVGVMTDDFSKHQKNHYPYIPLNERMEIVRAIRYVDEVVPVDYHNTNKVEAWKLYHFDVCFSGDDHAVETGFLEEQRILRELGSDMIFLPYTKSTSSTKIKKNISEGKSESDKDISNCNNT